MLGSLEVQLLGPLEVRVDGRLLDVPRGQVQTLVAGLAVSPGRPVSVDSLVEYLWDVDAAPLTARKVLQNTVWRLRRMIGADVVAAGGDAYRLAVEPDAVDAFRFTRLLDRAGTGGEAERELLAEALGLWRGEPLTGIESDTLRREFAPALIERYLAAVERRIDLDLVAGVRGGLVAELRALVAEHPVRESLWVRLLRALAASGRDAEALQAYEQVRRQLADQLGTDPCEELRELHQRLLTGAPLTDARPESPTPTATAAVPRQLPPRVSGFVGRGEQLAVLDKVLPDVTRNGATALVVVHGLGGVGKTALALQWAHDAAACFPDGQLYLDLRGYGPDQPMSPDAGVSAVLRSLGVPAAAIPSGLPEASALLRSTLAGRRILMLLDNARDAAQVRPLLPGSDAVVLVTTRGQLRGLSSRDGAVSLSLGQLPDTEARALLGTVVGAERVTAEPDATGQLIGLCGGIPLALRIAADLAARQPDLTLGELAGQLRVHRLELLSNPEDPTTDVGVVFSWSYRALTTKAAAGFRLLGLYPGDDIGLPAAAALFGGPEPEVRQTLTTLAAAHLVEQRRQGRYRMHDLLREYAAARAAERPEEGDQAVRRLLTWYLLTANHAEEVFLPDPRREPVLVGEDTAAPRSFASGPAAAAWFAEERVALIAAVSQAAAYRLDVIGWQLARSLYTYLATRAGPRELEEVATRGVECARRMGDPLAGYHMEAILGRAYAFAGRHRDGIAQFERALQHARALGDTVKVAAALSIIGGYYMHLGEHVNAIRYCERALAAAPSDNLTQRAQCLNNLGGAHFAAGNYDLGVRTCESAVAMWRKLGNRQREAWALETLATGHESAGRYEAAVRCGERAAEVARKAGDALTVAEALLCTGRAYRALGQLDAARAAWRQVTSVLQSRAHPMVAEANDLLAQLDGIT